MANIYSVQHRRGASSAWATTNPILLDGQLALESDTRRWKVGDGVSRYNDLPYTLTNVSEQAIAKLGKICLATDFGVVADGVTDDTYSFQAAVNAASTNYARLYVPSGTIRLRSQITGQNVRGIVGFGKGSTALVWDDIPSCGLNLIFTDDFRAQFTMRDLSLRQSGRRGTALLLDWSALSLTSTGEFSRFIVENVEAVGATGAGGEFGWNVGFDTIAGAYGTFRNCEMLGYITDVSGPAKGMSLIGFRFRGVNPDYDNGHPAVCKIMSSSVHYAETAMQWLGCEGVVARDNTVVAVDVGYLFYGQSTARPQFFVINCHANVYDYGIVCDTAVDSIISGNIIYRSPNATVGTSGVVVKNTAGSADAGHFIIRDNIFCDSVPGPSPSDLSCILVSNSHNGVIDSNVFRRANIAVSLDETADEIIVTNTNMYTDVETKLIDASPLNTIATALLSSDGYVRDASKVEQKWGYVVVALNEDGDGVITFPQPFKNYFMSAVVSLGHAASAVGTPVVNVSTCTSSQLDVSIRPTPGAVSVALSYQAIGY